ncbi:MAG: hypothetical protein ACOVOW_06725 [Spirosomataceae bacterium]
MQLFTSPSSFRHEWANVQQHAIEAYTTGQQSFIPYLIPEEAVHLPAYQVSYLLEKKWGQTAFYNALNPSNTVESPVNAITTTDWLKKVNMVGINVRTIKSFWNVVKYALTIPDSQSSIHLLPIWECGVVSSLYGIASWNINPEFFDQDLAQLYPHLNTVEKQLKVVINLLHLMGKTVGMDVIPHTDRYSEVVLANPHFFEWLQRRDFDIVNHRANLHEVIQERILDFLRLQGSANGQTYPSDNVVFFNNDQFSEQERLSVLFGEKDNLAGRNQRRNALINHLFSEGYEPVPATMAPPYRGLVVDKREEAKTVDAEGRIWRDYLIAEPQGMSRVFGPLSRFKLYEAKNDNLNWEIDFEKPRYEVWEYAEQRFASIAMEYNIDFMRGDMSHVQMNPAGTPKELSPYYDIHKYIKQAVRQFKPSFGYFAESFLAPPNTMAYGEEEAHLEGSDTDSTLGNLQSMVIDSEEFISEFARYHQLKESADFVPNFTIMTADKDDPRFDEFYLVGNELRMFLGLFVTDMPSYMALGFEQRDPHPTPAPNEHYTKLYVFQLSDGDKATRGDYQWGKNDVLFKNIYDLRCLYEKIGKEIEGNSINWIIAPDLTGKNKLIAWTYKENPRYVCLANFSSTETFSNINVQSATNGKQCKLLYSSNNRHNTAIELMTSDSFIQTIEPHECLLFCLNDL